MLIALALAAQAAPAAAAVAPDQWHWVSRWDPGKCRLIRTQGNPATAWLSIETTPGTESYSVSTRPYAEAARALVNRDARLVLLPAGTQLHATSVFQRRVHGTVGYDLGFQEGFSPDALAAANGLRVEVDGGPPFEIDLGHTASAASSLRRCIDQQLQNWGVDVAALAALRQRPRPLHPDGMAGYVNWTDYPSSAMRDRHSGTTVVRLEVDADGRPGACRAVISSGFRDLDQRTCEILSGRARFAPALDANGTPTSAPVITSLSWSVRSTLP